MKKIFGLILVIALVISTLMGCSTGEKESEFHSLVSETQALLDTVADDIYSYWYDCIYKDKYGESIDLAISSALVDNQENIDQIEANNEIIKSLYSDVKNGDLQSEIKAVMQAYNEYYSFVMEVSGSFKSFSDDKETLKKELASALKNLEFEL